MYMYFTMNIFSNDATILLFQSWKTGQVFIATGDDYTNQNHFPDPQKNKKHQCNYCGKCFHSASGLWKHKSVHTGRYSLNCSICGRGFNEKHYYEEHMNEHQGVGFCCMKCKRTFFSQSKLKDHQRKCFG